MDTLTLAVTGAKAINEYLRFVDPHHAAFAVDWRYLAGSDRWSGWWVRPDLYLSGHVQ